MTRLDETPFPERQNFFNGQRLFADDLQALEAFNQEMRWLHNSSLHPPGIGNGFAVRGRKTDRKVTVEPGYAIDVKGREIVLVESQELDVPPVAGEKNGEPVYYDLVVSYPDDDALEVAETRAGVCAPRGAVRLREAPVFCWVRLARTETGQLSVSDPQNGRQVKESLVARDSRLGADIEGGLRLVVARAEILNCQLNRDLSIAERRSARPALGPHLAAGEYPSQPWPLYWWTLEDELRSFLAELIQGRSRGGGGPVFAAAGAGFSRRLAALSVGRDPFLLGALGPIVLPLGFETVVPTRQACFRSAPHYMVRLAGERVFDLDLVEILQKQGLLELSALSQTQREAVEQAREKLIWTLFWEGLVSVLDPQPRQFTARLAVMIQLLEVPDVQTIRLLLFEHQIAEHIAAQFEQSPVGKKIAECRGQTGQGRETCVDEAVEMIIAWIEEVFLELIGPLDWSLVWMGVEG